MEMIKFESQQKWNLKMDTRKQIVEREEFESQQKWNLKSDIVEIIPTDEEI